MQSLSRSPQPPQQVPDQVEVTLLLSGGQEYTLSVPTQDLLLRQLFEVVMDWEGKRVKRLFQIPIHQGRAMLVFPCDRLVGLITNPPLIVQQPIPMQPTQTQQPIQSYQIPSPLDGARSNILASQVLQFDDFLSLAEHRQLLSYVQKQEAAFVNTSTSTGDLSHRRSLVLYEFPEFSTLIHTRIQSLLAEVLAKFGLADLPISHIESQLTAHNDGHYYRVHNDNGSPDTASRELTYVYYFNREPKRFSGGELRIYDSRIENNFFVRAESYKTIEPRNNSIVFFLSRYMHEVLPIRCPSGKFAASRFTINGWVRRV
ncbi:MAG: 2OG-Fe(II) oxygenase [Oscillatoriophycideae cyanobacterium NC_groundwater_1537_Pr4_S-0.65um_50_18]|nr:2OG-Fe(II) oxygenase [Oscillatoriophycideae cyanobacterium NC_groundwater_1537_Pr4_S-0.65um_50_18]